MIRCLKLHRFLVELLQSKLSPLAHARGSSRHIESFRPSIQDQERNGKRYTDQSDARRPPIAHMRRKH